MPQFGRVRSHTKAKDADSFARVPADLARAGARMESSATDGGMMRPIKSEGKSDGKGMPLMWCGAVRTKVPVFMQTLQLDVDFAEAAAAREKNAGVKKVKPDVAAKGAEGRDRVKNVKGRA
jgi:hypothetical protein